MIKIPLALLNLQDDGFHLLVEVVVFGQNFKAVLDTGASKTVFDKTIVERHIGTQRLKSSDRVSTGLGTTSMESFTWQLPDIQIGAFHLKNFEVAVLDLSSINFAYENLSVDPVIGVIGGDILTQYRGVIDYGKMTLTLKKTKKSP
ncbi:retropepsin-like aspartic protease [Olivibacter sp. XZL3]|uniref:retropepsin-like aspartic protease n=1 Tax=Olivibacter sp. XZL3 TaxID=1735116 RepID=UPI00106609F6|nr:retropepsin-like aspartic protease [Olivibacter sp. XZL3]